MRSQPDPPPRARQNEAPSQPARPRHRHQPDGAGPAARARHPRRRAAPGRKPDGESRRVRSRSGPCPAPTRARVMVMSRAGQSAGEVAMSAAPWKASPRKSSDRIRRSWRCRACNSRRSCWDSLPATRQPRPRWSQADAASGSPMPLSTQSSRPGNCAASSCAGPVVVAPSLDGVEVGDVEVAEGMQPEQSGDHVLRLAGGAERGADRLIGVARAASCVHHDPVLQVDDRNDLHSARSSIDVQRKSIRHCVF